MRFAFPRWTAEKRWYYWLTPVGWCVALIGLYRLTLSPILGNHCRFTPSCSGYALEALRFHRLDRALGLILWRILRCQPYCRGGYDPVPPPKKNKPQA